MKVVEEFKEFATKGNVVDLAVGVIIGGAFGKIVGVLVDKIMMPPLGYVIGGLDFSDFKFVLKAADPTGKGAVAIGYGEFIQAFINFIIIAWCLFILIKGMNMLRKKVEKQETLAENAAPPIPEDVLLLREIRDLLKSK